MTGEHDQGDKRGDGEANRKVPQSLAQAGKGLCVYPGHSGKPVGGFDLVNVVSQ